MSRKSFDDGHQNQAHTSGFNLDFNELHQLFHPQHRTTLRGVKEAAQSQGTDLGDLVDPQDDTYEEEGTHGQKGGKIGKRVGQAAGAYFGGTKGAAIGGKLGEKAGGYAEEKIKDPEFREDVKEKAGAAKEKAGEVAGVVREKGTEVAGKAMGALRGKLKGKGGAGLASPASEGVATVTTRSLS